ncbi:MAG: GntR family transcriptional regulator [bacterium]
MKNNNTTVDKIANFLRLEITYSNFKSGEHLKESEVAKKFSVSRVPVREAFRILQSEGYLDLIPNRGSFVKKITRNHILETGLVYQLLAPVVLEAAIPKYKEQTYKKAREIIRQVDKCKDFNKVGYLLWDFAKLIFGPSKLKFITGLFDQIYRNNIRTLNEVFEFSHNNFDTSNHKKFLELCKKNKKEAAIKLWNEYINNIEQTMLKIKTK